MKEIDRKGKPRRKRRRETIENGGLSPSLSAAMERGPGPEEIEK